MTTMDPVERGARMAQLRRDVGLLQRHVAAEFDIDKAAVSEWETGKSSPDRRKLARLDEMYDAAGEVLGLYDVASSELSRTVAKVEALARAVADLQVDFADVLHRLERLERGEGQADAP